MTSEHSDDEGQRRFAQLCFVCVDDLKNGAKVGRRRRRGGRRGAGGRGGRGLRSPRYVRPPCISGSGECALGPVGRGDEGVERLWWRVLLWKGRKFHALFAVAAPAGVAAAGAVRVGKRRWALVHASYRCTRFWGARR